MVWWLGPTQPGVVAATVERPKRRGIAPGVLVLRPGRGLWLEARAQGSPRNLGDLVISAARGGTAERRKTK